MSKKTDNAIFDGLGRTMPDELETVSNLQTSIAKIKLSPVREKNPDLFKPHKDNYIYFENDPEKLEEVKASFEKTGILQALVIYPDNIENPSTGVILSGHVRHEYAIEKGLSEIPVRYVEQKLTPFEQLLIMFGENETAKIDSIDRKILKTYFLYDELSKLETVSKTESDRVLSARLGISERMVRNYLDVIDRAKKEAGKSAVTIENIRTARENKNIERKFKTSQKTPPEPIQNQPEKPEQEKQAYSPETFKADLVGMLNKTNIRDKALTLTKEEREKVIKEVFECNQSDY